MRSPPERVHSPPERERSIFSFQTIVDFVLILFGHALGLDHHAALLIFSQTYSNRQKLKDSSDSVSYSKLTPHLKYVLGWQLKSACRARGRSRQKFVVSHPDCAARELRLHARTVRMRVHGVRTDPLRALMHKPT